MRNSINKNPRVLISILNWNNAEATIDCIESVINQSYLNYEIFLSDNNSADGSLQEIIKQYPKLKFQAYTENLGYALAHKKASEYSLAKGFDLLWILNNDTTVGNNSLRELILEYLKNPEVILGSLILEEDKKTIRFAGGYRIEAGLINFHSIWNPLYGEKIDDIIESNIPEEVSDVNGASILIPCEIIKNFGFMPIDFFLYGEETIYCYKLRLSGISSKIVFRSHIYHKGSLSFKNPHLKWVAAYYRKRNDLLLKKAFNLITNLDIIKQFKGLKFWVSFLCKSILLTFGFRNFSLKHYYLQLAIWHALINKKGKTLAPEKFI